MIMKDLDSEGNTQNDLNKINQSVKNKTHKKTAFTNARSCT